jgi:hypothetical protein
MSAPNVPEPAGAADVSAWLDDRYGAYRYFTGQCWVIDLDADMRLAAPPGMRAGHPWAVEVRIAGHQGANGHVKRGVVIFAAESADSLITVPQARELARGLMAACEEIERLQSCDETGGAS